MSALVYHTKWKNIFIVRFKKTLFLQSYDKIIAEKKEDSKEIKIHNHFRSITNAKALKYFKDFTI